MTKLAESNPQGKANIADDRVLCDVLKGKHATLKEDFIPEGNWDKGYWHIKKGTKVFIQGNESDGTCYIEYIEAVFMIDYRLLNIA